MQRKVFRHWSLVGLEVCKVWCLGDEAQGRNRGGLGWGFSAPT